MRKVAFLIFFVGTLLGGCQLQSGDSLKRHYEKVYALGLKYQDPNLKALAAANLYVLDSTQKRWRDSLFVAYKEANAVLPLSVLAPELYKERPNDTLVLIVMANLALYNQNLKEALSYQKKLFELTKNPVYQYQMIVSYSNMDSLEHARALAEEMLKEPRYAKMTIPIQVNEGQFQNVNIHAAAYNVLGYYAVQKRQIREAKSYFEKSLQLQPDYVLARQGYEFVRQFR